MRIAAFLFALISLLFLLPPGSGAVEPDAQPGVRRAIIRISPNIASRGALDLRLHPQPGSMVPAADFLLICPDGRKVGNDIADGVTYSEVAGAYYTNEGPEGVPGGTGPQSVVIRVNNPPDGEYTLLLFGLSDGTSSIEATGYSSEAEPNRVTVEDIKVKKGETREYRMRYSGTRKPPLQLQAK